MLWNAQLRVLIFQVFGYLSLRNARMREGGLLPRLQFPLMRTQRTRFWSIVDWDAPSKRDWGGHCAMSNPSGLGQLAVSMISLHKGKITLLSTFDCLSRGKCSELYYCCSVSIVFVNEGCLSIWTKRCCFKVKVKCPGKGSNQFCPGNQKNRSKSSENPTSAMINMPTW